MTHIAIGEAWLAIIEEMNPDLTPVLSLMVGRLMDGNVTWVDLQADSEMFGYANTRVLNRSLRELEAMGVISKVRRYLKPPRVTYLLNSAIARFDHGDKLSEEKPVDA